jgi:FAD dependent oxidoreductase TIGR03364
MRARLKLLLVKGRENGWQTGCKKTGWGQMAQRLAVVGAGIFGLAHAWAGLKAGYQVEWIERDRQAQGASIRNFGMVWPIGQPLGEPTALALRSRELWKEAARLAGVWLQPCGSIHLAHHPDEFAVLEEYADECARQGLPRRLLTSEEVQRLTPAANPAGLQGGLFSETEMAVDPPAAIFRLGQWLRSQPGVHSHFSAAALGLEPRGGGGIRIALANGEELEVDRAIVCSGADVQTLFPQQLAESGIRLCKLQMLKTAAQPGGWRFGPHLASGLTLRHYRAFEFCPSLARVKARFAETAPELDRYGIHVMGSQNEAGEIILGDSHEYDNEISPFDKQEIDALILRELAKVMQLPSWELAATWHGIYAKYPAGLFWEHEPIPGVSLRTGLGGNGMTLSLAIAEKFFQS